jgi:hypothetical protein
VSCCCCCCRAVPCCAVLAGLLGLMLLVECCCCASRLSAASRFPLTLRLVLPANPATAICCLTHSLPAPLC